MLEKIKKRLPVIILLVLVSLTLFVYYKTSIERQIATPPLPKPSATPIVGFGLSKIYPNQGTVEMAVFTTAIGLQFTKDVDIKTLKVNIVPTVEYEIASYSEKDLVYIRPVPEWTENETYNINISVKSIEGESTSTSFEFHPIFITNIDYQGGSI